VKILKPILFVMIAAISLQPLLAQAPADGENATQERTAPPPPAQSRIYYGGTLGFNLFGDILRLSVQPLVGYKITNQFSVGAKVGYEYLKDKRFDPTLTFHNYGASVFTRYRFVPQAYGHAEFAGLNFDYPTGREWVPFLLVGGGYAQQISSNAWVFAEVLFDVLQSSKSPYKAWEPWISVGVGVGF
jgi:hypothetical protein